MPIRVKVDTTGAVKGLHSLQRKDLPYAMARSLTSSAQAGEKAVQEALPNRFTLRNRFFQAGIRIKPADKKSATRIEADVHTYTANTKTGAPGFAERQEDGGERIPVAGHQHLAVPTRYLRSMAPGAIPAELRPRNLLGLAANQGRYMTSPRGKKAGKLTNARMVRGFVFFLQTLKDGKLAIMGRHMHDRDAYPFYLLIPAADIKPRLGMRELVAHAVAGAFPKAWAAAWRDILIKGLRIRF